MAKAERHNKILDFMLYNNNTATLEQLRELCNVTNETIRKDLVEMEKQRKVYRILGGAVLYGNSEERPVLQRYQENYTLKMAIAQKAASLVADGDFIALDSGTTNLCLAMCLARKEIYVLTNSLDIARELSKNEKARLFVAGGELRVKNMSMTGQATEDLIRNYRVTKAFLTSEGIGLDYGMMDAKESESRVKRAMMSIATNNYLLTDHTKFSVVTPVRTSPLNALTAIVTDSEVNPSTVEEYKKSGIHLIVADKLTT